jgi:[protein-PII] uridylyltransferase
MNVTQLLGEVFAGSVLSSGETDSFEKRRPRILEEYGQRLATCRERIRDWHRAGASGREVVDALTATTDTLLRSLLQEVAPGWTEAGKGSGLTLIAIGGYGRGELNPRSDIDLMFCHDPHNREAALRIAERMLYLLWDLGLDVASCVRTCEDCLELGRKDMTIRTSLMDSRFLDGDSAVFHHYQKSVMEAVRRYEGGRFIREKLAESETRQRKYGSSVYLLEPNIKEGKGGLRELHTALWVAKVKYKIYAAGELVLKGILTEKELEEIEKAFDYLWHVRNELHYLLQRKSDQIQFAQQERIAHFLGYRDQQHALAVEQFMKNYYTHAAHVVDISSALIAKVTDLGEPPKTFFGLRRPRRLDESFYVLQGELRTSCQEEAFAENPLLMLQAFRHSQHQEVKLCYPLQEIIRRNAGKINERARRSREMGDLFLDILRAPQRVAETLWEMHHLHFLQNFIPEFGDVFCMVQHDSYHIYTVDIHSLFAVEELVRLWRGEYADQHPLLTEVAAGIEKRELMLLAVLLHDIGKGEGSGHSEKGAGMMPAIARRLGLGREDSLRLEFLVRHHLIMAHISQRRDLNDDKTIYDFARLMGTSENLQMLYLLTFADLKAVGPDVWTLWKGFLLDELYQYTFGVLEKGDFPHEKRSEKIQRRKRQVVELLATEFGERAVKEELKQLETRYFVEHNAEEIGQHLRVLFSRGKRPLAMKADPVAGANHTRLIFSTLDLPGLFSKLTGVLAAGRVNILGAQIYTLKSGVALDILHVDDGNGQALNNPAKWTRIEKALTAVIEGREQVDELVVKSRSEFTYGLVRPPRRFPDRVEIDNEVSEHYTVIDVYTQDRVGLLYDITRTLAEMNLTIGVSKISTKVDQVADTFYVKDIFGYKITRPEKVTELRDRLLAAVGDEHGA